MKLENKKVLVTGADGFIGSHLVEELVRLGCQVRAFVFYNSFNSWGWLEDLDPTTKEAVEIFTGDIRDPYGTRKAVQGCDIVFHLAALIGIPFSYDAPASYIDTNVKGTLNVLQACREFNPERVMITSTSEVYGTAQYVPMDESHPLQAQSPYSASKIAADRLAESFYYSFGVPITIARPFNTYGPRQSARAVIPTIISQLLSGKTEIKLGNLSPTRDYTYVTDTCQGFLRILESSKTVGQEINIASNFEISIGDLAQKIIGSINPQAKIISTEERKRPSKSEVERLFGSNTKIKTLTSWSPHYSLEEGLGETIAWIEKNLGLYKTEIYSV